MIFNAHSFDLCLMCPKGNFKIFVALAFSPLTQIHSQFSAKNHINIMLFVFNCLFVFDLIYFLTHKPIIDRVKLIWAADALTSLPKLKFPFVIKFLMSSPEDAISSFSTFLSSLSRISAVKFWNFNFAYVPACEYFYWNFVIFLSSKMSMQWL